ncbi:MAG: oligogalacturonate lyase family protein [Planctomycetota bacterium]
MSQQPTTYIDPDTGRPVTRWTSGEHKDQHLYLTGPSVTADDRWLVIISQRDGHPNLWAIDRQSGAARQLSRNRNGKRMSYCHSDGGPAGLSKSSPSLDATRGRVYTVIDDRLERIDLVDGATTVLTDIPAGWITAFTQVSADGTRICVPLTPATAFADTDSDGDQARQMEAVHARVAAGSVRSRLLIVDTTTGTTRCAAEVPFWVTHVQFDPHDADRVLFNSEGHWHQQDAIARMWMLEADGTTHPLIDQAPGLRLGHECWTPDGRSIVYHGYSEGGHLLRAGGHFIGRCDAHGTVIEEIPMADAAVHHACLLNDGRYLADTFDNRLVVIDPRSNPATTTTICRTDIRHRADQDVHPHAVPTPRGVLFTSDRASPADVYEVMIEPAPPMG